MRIGKSAAICLVVSALAATALFAQEGYPLKGSWLGDWGSTKTARIPFVVVIDWDGKSISGTLNPGADNAPLKNAILTPPAPRPQRGAPAIPATPGSSDWLVHFEADAKVAGSLVHYVFDGKIENIGVPNRVVKGTWTDGTAKSDFKMARQ